MKIFRYGLVASEIERSFFGTQVRLGLCFTLQTRIRFNVENRISDPCFSYVYIDAAELSRENVFSVLYLAKKYRLTRLIRDAYEFCADTLAGSKVVELLPQLHLFDEEHAEMYVMALDHVPMVSVYFTNCCET